MRISFQTSMNTLMGDLNEQRAELYRSQQVVSSTLEVEKASDDPIKARQIMQLNGELSQTDQFATNVEGAMTYLSFTDNELQNVQDLLTEARALAVQGATETMDESDRTAAAERVEQILNELVSIANSRHGDRYLFGGFNTQEAPYELDTDPATGETIQVQDLPSGMDGVIYANIGEQERVQMNIPGTDVFQTGAPGDSGDMFDVLIDLRDGLQDDDSEAIQDTITRFDDASDRVGIARAKVGGIIMRLENTENRLAADEVNKTQFLSDAQDADMAEWIQKLELQQIALEMAMEAGTQTFQQSLLNFIG